MNHEFETLNESQRQAVFTKAKKVLVMSGAGAGKTKVLTNRIAYLLECGVSEGDIIAFTFTNKAAREMRTRLNKILGRETKAFIGTFHSYCYNMLKIEGNYYKVGFKYDPELITESEKSRIIKDILSKYNKNYSNIPFVSAISKIKNGVKIDNINPEDLLILNAVYKEYQEKLRESSMMDFDDMIPLFLKFLEEDKMFCEMVCQYQYVLIDECQDTNLIQYDLIKKLSEHHQNIFMVGDEDQLIYSFRSSDIAILNDFKNKADEIIILNENYRCNKEILTLANKLISFNQDRLKKYLISHIEANRKVTYKDFISQVDEAEEVATRIKQLNLSGEAYDTMAVLYRNNSQMYVIEKKLAQEKIPYTVYGGMAFFEYADIKNIIYLYRLLYNPRNEIAFETIYNKPMNHIEWYEIKEVLDNYHKQDKDIITYLTTLEDQRLKDLGQRYQKLKQLMEELRPSEFLMEVMHYLKYDRYFKMINNIKPEYQRLMTLKDMLEDLSRNEVKEFFNNIMLENKDIVKPNGVSLMTIHKSKGLEFNTVFIIGCNDGIIPGYSKKIKDLEEDRRVFYVAMTRARQNLFLYSSQLHFVNGQKFKLKPSQFLVEAGVKANESEEFFGKYWYNK